MLHIKLREQLILPKMDLESDSVLRNQENNMSYLVTSFSANEEPIGFPERIVLWVEIIRYMLPRVDM